MIFRRKLHKIGKKNTEFHCENYFVDDNDDCECVCNDNGDDNNGLVQFHTLVSSKLSIVFFFCFFFFEIIYANSIGKLQTTFTVIQRTCQSQ